MEWRSISQGHDLREDGKGMDYRVKIGWAQDQHAQFHMKNRKLQHLKSASQAGRRNRETVATEVKGGSVVMEVNRIECSGKRQFNDTK